MLVLYWLVDGQMTLIRGDVIDRSISWDTLCRRALTSIDLPIIISAFSLLALRDVKGRYHKVLLGYRGT